MYGTKAYGTSYYGKQQIEDIINNIHEDCPHYLKQYIPKYIYKTKNFYDIYRSQEKELYILYYQINDISLQCSIDTATWGLVYWEKQYGIGTNVNLTYEERREIIKAKKRGQGVCSIEMIKNVCEAFSGGEVNVIENSAPYTFTIQFVGVKGIPRNMNGLKETINNIKPAHLLYEFKYTYTTWGYLDSKNITWKNAEALTWDELEIYE